MKIEIFKLHPTQISIGYQQVNEKICKLLYKTKKELDKYLKNHLVPVIIGPENKHYIIDHHHLCCALNKLSINEVYYYVKKDLSKLSNKDFWKNK